MKLRTVLESFRPYQPLEIVEKKFNAVYGVEFKPIFPTAVNRIDLISHSNILDREFAGYISVVEKFGETRIRLAIKEEEK